MLTKKQLEHLHSVLKPTRRESALAFALKKWETEIRRAQLPPSKGPLRVSDELVAELLTMTEEVPAQSEPARYELAEYAALMLAVIFYEHTGEKPTRHTDLKFDTTNERDKGSPFYQFAMACFACIKGLHPHETALRRATERWNNPASFKPDGMRTLIYGKLEKNIRT